MESFKVDKHLQKKLQDYKKKFYLNALIKGLFIFILCSLSTYLVFNTLEYFFYLNQYARAFLFFSFTFLTLYLIATYVIVPTLKMLGWIKGISSEKIAVDVGQHFPEINDKLLNTLQLSSTGFLQGDLLKASIAQKTSLFDQFNFSNAIPIRSNKKYLKYLLPLICLITGVLVIYPTFFSESSKRIMNYTQSFERPAPFTFQIENTNLSVFKNEPLHLYVHIKGSEIPQNVYLIIENKKLKMSRSKEVYFEYKFNKLDKSFDFQLEGAGYYSKKYHVNVLERPLLQNFKIHLKFPQYLNKKEEELVGIGSFTVPEGTQALWQFETAQTDTLSIYFEGEKKDMNTHKKNTVFSFQRKLLQAQNYEVKLKNTNGNNKNPIKYHIDVIPDHFPKIEAESYSDSSLYHFINVGGNIRDDYGISSLKLFYKIKSDQDKPFKAILIPTNNQTTQSFYFQINTDSLQLQLGDALEYYVQVWDNDGVNGYKSSRTPSFFLNIPDADAYKKEIEKNTQVTEKQINKTISDTKELKKKIEDLQNKLKSKSTLDYNDQKQIEELLKKRALLEKDIQSLKEQLNTYQEKVDKIRENQNNNENIEQLKKLMDNLLDDETKKLYEELEELLNKNKVDQNTLDLLEKIQNKDEVVENEIERALEMFKQLQYEQKYENIEEDLKKLSEDLQDLSDQTKEAPKENTEKQKIEEEQDRINKKFEDIREELEKLDEINKDLENPHEKLDMQDSEEKVGEDLKNSSENLKKEQLKKASENQNNAQKEMKKMLNKMQEQKEKEKEKTISENIENLRSLLENLIKLSFQQEELINSFEKTGLSDPKLISLSQEQLKLQDDSKIVEDSLIALSKRVFQMESFINKELGDMKAYLRESSEAIKERRLLKARTKQQFAMTSMNNLALMLSDVLEQMQQSMSMDGSGDQKMNLPGLNELQKKLNQQIQELKKSGQSGKPLSKELSRLATQQEMIRRALEKLSKKDGGNGKSGEELQKIIKKMEETEEDLINKQLTEKTIQRQKEIITRLLDAEKAQKERGEDEKRKGETAKTKTISTPKSMEKYMKSKIKQIELLKKTPPSLKPYYKKEVDEYYDKIKN